MVSAAARYGLAPVLGECGTVGIAGLTLGGGLGWLSGRYGATCDNLLSVDLSTADSRAIIANEQSNPDLFWALRGGGGNFGVATSLQYRLQPVAQVLAGGFAFRFGEARHVLRSYREFMETAPDGLQALAYLAAGQERVVTVIVVYSGDLQEGERVVAKVRSFGAPMRDTVQRRALTETFSLQPHGESVPTAFSVNKTSYVLRLSDEAIDASLERFAACPAGSTMGFDHYMHGQVCRVPPDATAFELRAPGALHVWISSGWNDPAAAATFMTWADDTWKTLQPYSGGRLYANYMSVEGDSAVRAVYGSNYSRLASIKKKYDPGNLFRLNPNIRPSEIVA
jgi:FAD/FMN-containing dehydrogenase